MRKELVFGLRIWGLLGVEPFPLKYILTQDVLT
jgi:hypothetical protein